VFIGTSVLNYLIDLNVFPSNISPPSALQARSIPKSLVMLNDLTPPTPFVT